MADEQDQERRRHGEERRPEDRLVQAEEPGRAAERRDEPEQGRESREAQEQERESHTPQGETTDVLDPVQVAFRDGWRRRTECNLLFKHRRIPDRH